MGAVPAQAQTSQQLEVYGYVAPRCWVSDSATRQLSADGTVLPPRAICNHATPRQESRVRTLNADGSLKALMVPAAFHTNAVAPQNTGRTAMEILVSPQL